MTPLQSLNGYEHAVLPLGCLLLQVMCVLGVNVLDPQAYKTCALHQVMRQPSLAQPSLAYHPSYKYSLQQATRTALVHLRASAYSSNKSAAPDSGPQPHGLVLFIFAIIGSIDGLIGQPLRVIHWL